MSQVNRQRTRLVHANKLPRAAKNGFYKDRLQHFSIVTVIAPRAKKSRDYCQRPKLGAIAVAI